MIIIDYLQLMSGSGGGENRATEISEISRSLKGLAKELRLPLDRPVAVEPQPGTASQQTPRDERFARIRRYRAGRGRDPVHLPGRSLQPGFPDKGTAEIIIGKQRNGPIGTVRLTFQGMSTRFLNFTAGPQY